MCWFTAPTRLTAEPIHDKKFNGVFSSNSLQRCMMGERKKNRSQKKSAGAAWSDECVKTAQRKLAGRDGGAGMAGQNIRGDSVMNGFSGK